MQLNECIPVRTRVIFISTQFAFDAADFQERNMHRKLLQVVQYAGKVEIHDRER